MRSHAIHQSRMLNRLPHLNPKKNPRESKNQVIKGWWVRFENGGRRKHVGREHGGLRHRIARGDDSTGLEAITNTARRIFEIGILTGISQNEKHIMYPRKSTSRNCLTNCWASARLSNQSFFNSYSSLFRIEGRSGYMRLHSNYQCPCFGVSTLISFPSTKSPSKRAQH